MNPFHKTDRALWGPLGPERERLVTERLHDSYRGLAEGEGLDWLLRTLHRLESTGDPGLSEIVRSFLGLMHRPEGARGFSEEVRMADALLDLAGPGNVLGNRQDGTARAPCDVTMHLDGVRVDVQCKSVNDLAIDELLSWLGSRFRDLDPGTIVEVWRTPGVDMETVRQLKHVVLQEARSGLTGKEVTFRDSRGRGTVKLRFSPNPEGPGLVQGFVWLPSDTLCWANAVDVDKLRATVHARVLESHRTFGFRPSPTQHNLVSISFADMVITLPEVVERAMYGLPYMECGPGGVGFGIDESGLLTRANADFVSGIVVTHCREFTGYDNILYPHPAHAESLVPFWEGRRHFRLSRHPHLAPRKI